MPSHVAQIDPKQLSDLLASGAPLQLIDVREDQEVAINLIAGSTHIPMNSIPARIRELDAAIPTVVYCHHGQRSYMVARYLVEQGFAEVLNLDGGIDSYAASVDPSLGFY